MYFCNASRKQIYKTRVSKVFAHFLIKLKIKIAINFVFALQKLKIKLILTKIKKIDLQQRK